MCGWEVYVLLIYDVIIYELKEIIELYLICCVKLLVKDFYVNII